VPLPQADLGGRLGWIFGAEGQGVSAALQERAALRITIPTAPGTESINVAAAAAICLHAAFSRPAAGS
jgi:TrmH family RNA methyltransferase